MRRKMHTNQFNGISGVAEPYQTIVIGGGQAGLAVGYYLAQLGFNFVILDASQRTGDSWRKRWDSLKLFTPAKFNNLPGMPFPQQGDYLPTKSEVADYLEHYAKHFNLPIQHGVKVESLDLSGGNYQIRAGGATFAARNVIVATSPFQFPSVPGFSGELDPSIYQLHSSAYLNPQQVLAQHVLVVGAGNSGADISLELTEAGRKVWLSGRSVGRIPTNTPVGKAFDGRLAWWIMSHILSVSTPIGKKVRSHALQHGGPLGHVTRQEIAATGVELTSRVSGIQAGKPLLEDGRVLEVDGVIWATGFHPDYSWLHLPIFDQQGYPRHWRGVVKDAPGLYFIGLMFQSAITSSLLGGVGADAAYITSQISLN
jgi:putative flavoprotein involved in K+ transport